MSVYANVEMAPPIEVFHVNKMYLDDTNSPKVNLSIGAYRTEEEKPWVLPVVREAERRLAADESQNHEYLPVLGFEPFTQAASQLLLGDDSPAIKEGRVAGIQCLSGTGSLRVGAEFLTRTCKLDTVFVSNPSWENHHLVFRNAGFAHVEQYRYWDAANRKIDFEGLCADLRKAPENAVVILHGCAHNPTGMDPSQDEWKAICQIVKERRLFTFFDIAYQGFASGDPDHDAWAVRYFVSQGMEMVVSQSFAKNFGLYNERVGNLTLVVADASRLPAIKSQISLLIRANWSNPPNHGAKVVHMVLTNPEMRRQWFSHIQEMSGRIKLMRKTLREKLEALGTPGTWTHVTSQIGMFSFTGLTEKQVEVLRTKYHIYLLKSGRINMCGVNTKNVEYLAKAIDDVVRNVA